MRALELAQLLQQLVVLDVADRRRRFDVVTPIVLGQLVDELQVVVFGITAHRCRGLATEEIHLRHDRRSIVRRRRLVARRRA
jgi:hypothetical protein